MREVPLLGERPVQGVTPAEPSHRKKPEPKIELGVRPVHEVPPLGERLLSLLLTRMSPAWPRLRVLLSTRFTGDGKQPETEIGWERGPCTRYPQQPRDGFGREASAPDTSLEERPVHKINFPSSVERPKWFRRAAVLASSLC